MSFQLTIHINAKNIMDTIKTVKLTVTTFLAHIDAKDASIELVPEVVEKAAERDTSHISLAIKPLITERQMVRIISFEFNFLAAGLDDCELGGSIVM